MKLDTDRIDEAVLALLSLGLHEDQRAWPRSCLVSQTVRRRHSVHAYRTATPVKACGVLR